MLVGVHVSSAQGASGCAQYLPPVLNAPPPQTIIWLPVHTAVWNSRPPGAPVPLVAVQLSVLGLYLPPVLKTLRSAEPPQAIICLPVHTAVGASRTVGAPVVVGAAPLAV